MRKQQEKESFFINPQTGLVFMFALAALGIASWWPIYHNFVSELAIDRWSKIIEAYASEDFRVEDIRLLYPHLTNLLLLLFYPTTGLIKFAAPYLISCIFGAGLLALWNFHLREKNYTLRDRIILMALVAIHPYFLWGVTDGLLGGLSLLMFYLLYLSSVRLIKEADARSFIMLGVVFGVYFFVDERTLFIFVAFLPLLPLIAPRNMLKASPSSVYLIIAMPLVLSVVSWVVYLSFVLDEGAWHYMSSPGESFRGAWHQVGEIEWLRDYGGSFFSSLLASIVVGLISYPVVLWLVWRARRHIKLLRDIEALLIHLSTAAALATATFFLAHPADMLYLTAAGVMAAIVLLPREIRWFRGGLFLMLLISAIGGWVSLSWKPTVEMQRWTKAMSGEVLPSYFPEDTALGHWLDKNRMPTMVDEHAAFRALVTRGDSDGLMLSFTQDFKKMLQKDVPTADQVVVRDPQYIHGDRTSYGSEVFTQRLPDGVTQRYHDMYSHGMDGYHLVYDQGHWRVYRRNEASPLDGSDSFTLTQAESLRIK